jgi:pimeloyl-ACP methyl ester carboxylesterase
MNGSKQSLTFQVKSKLFLLIVALIFSMKSNAQSVYDGVWHAGFTVVGQSFLIDLSVDSRNSEVYVTNPESASRIKNYCTNTVFSKNEIQFEWPAGHLQFSGNCNEKGDSLVGKMTQNGFSWNVLFLRNNVLKPLVLRPQEPIPPFPYKTVALAFKNERDDIMIHGTFTYPVDTTGTYPIVIFDSGSGPQNRDGAILGHKPFLLLADAFAKSGVASFRFDDRGSGESSESYADASLEDFASDVMASIAYLAQQKAFKGHKIGLLGHSEGGMHILMAQNALPKKVSFMLFLASPGVSGKEVLVQQQYEMPLRNGLNDSIARWNQQLYEDMSTIVCTEKDYNRANELLRTKLLDNYRTAPVGALDSTITEQQFINGNAPFLNNDWGREFLKYDPRIHIHAVKVPMFFLYGGEDSQVNPTLNSEGIRKALSAKQLERSEFHSVPGLNHLLQTCHTCVFSEYGELTETLSPIAIQLMLSFLQKQ